MIAQIVFGEAVVPTWETAHWPATLCELRETIEESRSILEWEDNWDGEGSPAYSVVTWSCAADLLTQLAISAYETTELMLPSPAILAGPNGSFDLHWKLPEKELLINVGAGAEAPIRYYGDNRSRAFTLEGQLDPSKSNFWMALWLLQR